MPRRLLALDLDGTLIEDGAHLPAGHERVVREIRQTGIEVAIVTGRPTCTATWIQDHLELTAPMVSFNGAWVGLPGRPALHSQALDEGEVRAIVAVLASGPAAISCYPDADHWVLDRELPFMRDWRTRYRTGIQVDRDRVHAWRGTSGKVMCVGEPDDLPPLAEALRRAWGERFHIVFSEPDRFEVSRRGITKAWGLERLCAHLGIARENVWAVGDAANDTEMIQWAGHGCAMGQAPWSLRQHARHVLPGIAARGLCALPDLIRRHP